MHLRSLASVLTLSTFALLVVACPKEDKKPETKDDKAATEKKTEEKSTKKSGDDDGEKKKPKKDDKTAKGDDDDDKGDDTAPAGGRSIGGVTVPPWKKPKHTAKNCKPGKDDEAKLAALKKGDDGGAGFDDGKGDVQAIVSEMTDTCPSAGATVSQALNAGGYTRYSKKAYEDADGWFARALVADSSNTFARYNLACNLALEGKSDDALWNLGELVPAARAGDPRALHYLDKAKSDSDLKSVRSDAKFGAATSAGDALAKAHPCDDGLVWNGRDKCIRVCNAFNTKANCTEDDLCIGAMTFGDGLVPYCDDPLKCNKSEVIGLDIPDEDDWSTAKRACVLPCDTDADCPAGKKCGGMIALPNIYNGFWPATGCH